MSGNNGTNWGGIATAGAGLAGGVLGMIGQGKRAKKAHNRNKELMGIQFDNQQKLNQQGHELQMKTWRDTGYEAQMKMMKDAGLNPGLMYGMSGGGGQTTGSQGGGSASGNSSHAPMDIGASVQASLMAAQVGKIVAETEQIKKNTNKIEIDKEKIAQEIKNLQAGENTEKERTALVKLQALFESEKIDNMKRNTELVNKKITTEEAEAKLKEYEVGLNKLGIQKTDNKIFRFLTNQASKFGFDLGDLIKNYLDRADENKDVGIFGKPNNNRN
jgi:hypothetical protein